MKPELQWEIENGLRLTAMDVAVASRARTAWYHAVAKFFEKYDFMIAPAGQVFPFDAKIHWPKEVGGVSMDTYHRWMQVMIPISMSGCPALSVPAGFNDRGLPMGIQIVGPNHAEMACMQLAHAYDQATNWVTKRPPPLLSQSLASCYEAARELRVWISVLVIVASGSSLAQSPARLENLRESGITASRLLARRFTSAPVRRTQICVAKISPKQPRRVVWVELMHRGRHSIRHLRS